MLEQSTQKLFRFLLNRIEYSEKLLWLGKKISLIFMQTNVSFVWLIC